MYISLVSLHPRVLSGQIDSLVGLGRALQRVGHNVKLLAPFDTSGLLERSLINLDEGPSGLIAAANRMLQTLPKIITAAEQSDLLYLALPTPAFGALGDFLATRISCPMVVAFEGHLADARVLLRPARLRESWKTYLPLWGVNNGFWGRLGVHHGQRYIVSSRVQEEELIALGFPRERVAVISNLVDAEKLVGVAHNVARNWLGLPDDRILIGYIGHFNDVKGVDILARAFTHVVRSEPRAHLVLAWSGQGKRERVTRYLDGHMTAVSWLGKVLVGTFLSALDVLVLPYRSTAGQGAFPSLPIEAFHMGCPLVMTRLPLLAELEGGSGGALLAEPESVESLQEALLASVTDAQMRYRMREAQRRLIQQRFGVTALLPQYEAVFDQARLGVIGRVIRRTVAA